MARENTNVVLDNQKSSEQHTCRSKYTNYLNVIVNQKLNPIEHFSLSKMFFKSVGIQFNSIQ